MGLRVTQPTLLVLGAILDSADGETYGLGIRETTGLYGGTVYPILARLERLGWVVSRQESHGDAAPPRRYYRLMPERVAEVKDLLAERLL